MKYKLSLKSGDSIELDEGCAEIIREAIKPNLIGCKEDWIVIKAANNGTIKTIVRLSEVAGLSPVDTTMEELKEKELDILQRQNHELKWMLGKLIRKKNNHTPNQNHKLLDELFFLRSLTPRQFREYKKRLLTITK
jgi:hypothetical protein